MVSPKLIFARIGHMHFYAGPQEGDERPKHGGSFNDDGIGYEAYNFKKIKKMFYGYIQPYEPPKKSGREITINLKRIDPAKANDSKITDVLVVFVARTDDYGQVIVGWYNSATVYRDYQDGSLVDSREVSFIIKANVKNSVLLPIKYRSYKIPAGKKGAFGRANIVYTRHDNGNSRNLSEPESKWIKKALTFIQEYEGPNLVTNPTYDTENEIEDVYESNQVVKSGQGFKIDPKLRREIEKYSVSRAINYFRRHGYKVDDVGKYKSYDLDCNKDEGNLRVEVKGTQTTGESIILTKNEVENARKNKTALYILHSIKVDKKRGRYFLSEGVTKIFNPWDIHNHGELLALSYSYKLN